MQDNVWVEFNKNKTNANFRSNFLAIKKAKYTFSALYSGYIGVAPFSGADEKELPYNFVY